MSESRKMDFTLEEIRKLCQPHSALNHELASDLVNRQLMVQFEFPELLTKKMILFRRLLMGFLQSKCDTFGDYINDEKTMNFILENYPTTTGLKPIRIKDAPRLFSWDDQQAKINKMFTDFFQAKSTKKAGL